MSFQDVTCVLACCAIAGCASAERPETARAIERLAEAQKRLSSELSKRPQPVVKLSPQDWDPLLAELRKVRAERRSQDVPQTGARVYVDAVDGRCAPCRWLERDLNRLAKETRWTVGPLPTSHWQIVRHATPEFPIPRIEFLVEGRVVDVVEGYPNHPSRTGYYGPIDDLLTRHPQVER